MSGFRRHFKKLTVETMNEVTIFVEPIDVKKWQLFQEYYDPFTVMVNAGVFSTKNGSIALNFDSQGILQNIQRADYLYSRKHS